MNTKKVYAIKDAAKLFDEVTEYTIWKGIREKRIPYIKLGRKYYVTKEDVYNAVYRDLLGDYVEVVHSDENVS